MARLRQHAHARLLGNGLCTRPAQLDRRMETMCEPAPASRLASSSAPSSSANATTPPTATKPNVPPSSTDSSSGSTRTLLSPVTRITPNLRSCPPLLGRPRQSDDGGSAGRRRRCYVRPERQHFEGTAFRPGSEVSRQSAHYRPPPPRGRRTSSDWTSLMSPLRCSVRPRSPGPHRRLADRLQHPAPPLRPRHAHTRRVRRPVETDQPTTALVADGPIKWVRSGLLVDGTERALQGNEFIVEDIN
jgi:hypothetical protein